MLHILRSTRVRAAFLAVALLSFGPLADHLVAQVHVKGHWSEVYQWPNVCIHVHLLPNGKVLWWGRRDWTATAPVAHPTAGANGLDFPETTLYQWDPATAATAPVALPARSSYNLFCSGHGFLPDGRLFIAGGHIRDSVGRKEASIFDYRDNSLTRTADMNFGRWYPTVLTLPDGRIFCAAGTYEYFGWHTNDRAQVWHEGKWDSFITRLADISSYHWSHSAPGGKVFVSGWNKQTFFAEPSQGGTWSVGPMSPNPQRETGTAVSYLPGKVMICGGNQPPENSVQTIDLLDGAPRWTERTAMHYPRRHATATVLPNGRVLVTGGTQGGTTQGAPPPDPADGRDPFTDHTQPVKEPELWNPETGMWDLMAPEAETRIYHSTALLLPSGEVLSAGGGEWNLPFAPGDNMKSNVFRAESRRTAQIFSPPYLFREDGSKAPRPFVTEAPEETVYGAQFRVAAADVDRIAKVTWVRLGSMTHSFNQGQSFHPLSFVIDVNVLKVTAPATPELCPPGHYMMFLIDRDGVPSMANIIKISNR